MAWHNELGKWGEDVAAKYLEDKGWYIRDRNWVWNHKELDLVCIDEACSTLLVVEVKTRATDAFGDPADAVTLEKQSNTLKAANVYMKMHHLGHLNLRYDIVSVIGTPEGGHRVEHMEDAFDVFAGWQYSEQRRKSARYRWKHRPGCW